MGHGKADDLGFPAFKGLKQLVDRRLLVVGELDARSDRELHLDLACARRLDDPQSATLFLLLVPGVVTGLFALLEGVNAVGWSGDALVPKVLSVWLSRALGIGGSSCRMIRSSLISPAPGGSTIHSCRCSSDTFHLHRPWHI